MFVIEWGKKISKELKGEIGEEGIGEGCREEKEEKKVKEERGGGGRIKRRRRRRRRRRKNKGEEVEMWMDGGLGCTS